MALLTLRTRRRWPESGRYTGGISVGLIVKGTRAARHAGTLCATVSGARVAGETDLDLSRALNRTPGSRPSLRCTASQRRSQEPGYVNRKSEPTGHGAEVLAQPGVETGLACLHQRQYVTTNQGTRR